MTAASWAAAALVCLHLGSLGALPPEVRTADVRPYISGDRKVRVLVTHGSKKVVMPVGLESYIAGVIYSEMPRDFPLEAMKAQAIAARTYTLYHLGNHEKDNADLCASVHCQVYGGQAPAASRAARATRETAGQVLAYNGLLVDTLYHADCGGETATAWQVRQGKLLPYEVGGYDAPEPGASPYCTDGHETSWTRRYTAAEADRLVRQNLARVMRDPGIRPGRLIGMRVVKGDGASRVQWLKVSTTTGTYQVRGDAIRWLFGTGRAGPLGLRSTDFDLTVKTDRAGRPRAFVFQGRGHGHGIGLCQWGARGRAFAGQTAEEILAAYYPGTMIVDLRHDTVGVAFRPRLEPR